MTRARRPHFSAAIKVVPEPAKQSSTTSPRLEQSRMASATSATGFTVGCMASSSVRPAHRVHPGIVPHVGAVAAGVAEAKGVGVRRGAHLEDEDQLVLGAVERPHTAIRL